MKRLRLGAVVATLLVYLVGLGTSHARGQQPPGAPAVPPTAFLAGGDPAPAAFSGAATPPTNVAPVVPPVAATPPAPVAGVAPVVPPVAAASPAPAAGVAPVVPPVLSAAPANVPALQPVPSGGAKEVTAVPPPPSVAPAADPLPSGPLGKQEPAVSIEWLGPPSARLGQPTNYQIVVRNVSSTPAHQVVVRHRPPEGVTVPASEPRPQIQADGVLSWDLGTLPPTQERRIDLRLVPAGRAALDLNAAVTFTGMSGLLVQVREPKLVLKVVAPERVVLGDAAAVTLTVSNPGDGPADHVRVKAVLGEGLEHTRGRQIEIDLGQLAPKEQRSIQLVCGARLQGAQKCEASAVADSGLSAQDTAQVEVTLPRIDLAASGPRLRYLERHATYVFKVTNPGSAPASNVTVTDVVPPGFKFHAASAGGRYDFSTRTVAWFIGDLLPGQSREVTVEAVAAELGEHKHVAAATGARGLKADAEVLTHVEGLSALVVELTEADDPVEVGAETSYEVRLINSGSKMETNVQLSCTLPERMEFRGAYCAGGCRFRVEGREVIFEPVPRVAPRADVVYRINVRGTGPGDVRFQARVRADGLVQPVVREEATKIYGDDPLPR